MKEITFKSIADAVCERTRACSGLTASCSRAMRAAYDKESNENAKFALEMLMENAEVAKDRGLPVCQDTGMAVVFVKLGQDVHISGGLLTDAIDEGVRRGYRDNGYRATILPPLRT